ncbi:MAG: sodium:proton antiporter [Verrucomicrobiales bacterium]|nr:sodium:proton antiporter [Verrucomicrobiales bacterium]
MSEEILKSIGVILLLGIGAQWLAWRLRLPSILLLLIAGVVGGPVFGWVKPDELLGPLLMPFVSVSVALILFEGGLTLKLSEWRAVGTVVRNLVTLGAMVSWVGTTMAAHWLLGWSWQLATLLGAILVVTGPTVIMPLLRQVQPSRNLSSALKWEGILIDPIGALLALLVFEAIAASSLADVPGDAIRSFGLTMLVGLVLGGLGAALLTFAFSRYFVPDHLQNPVALTLVVGLFVASNLIQHESGLLTATVMGVLLANQKAVDMHPVLHFKENLRVLLISLLFILLAARIEPGELRSLSFAGLFLLLATLVLVVRPLSVLAATWGSKFAWRERWFLAGLAPRGVVAAAVASIFALRLAENGMERAGELVSVTFFVIIGTVTVYGLGAGPFARWLKVSQPNPQGALVVGANPIGRAVAKALRDEGFAVLVVDTNREHLAAVRMQGGSTYYGSILSELAMEEIDFTGLGRLLAMTPSNEVNFLASVRFRSVFGSSEVYQLAGLAASDNKRHRVSRDLRGRCLFGDGLTGELLEERIHQGATVKKTKLSKEFTFEKFRERYGDHAVPLFTVSEKRQVQFATRDKPLSPQAGQTLVSLVDAGWPPEK